MPTEGQNLDETIPNNDISSPRAQAVMGMQLMAMRPPRDKISVFGMGEREINWYIPHCCSGESQVTVVPPLNLGQIEDLYTRADGLLTSCSR
jgi:hypothetical protein